MNLKFLFLVILIFTLTIPLMNIQIFSSFAQNSDKSFKGNEAPFIHDTILSDHDGMHSFNSSKIKNKFGETQLEINIYSSKYVL
jgi:hypothetical protein